MDYACQTAGEQTGYSAEEDAEDISKITFEKACNR